MSADFWAGYLSGAAGIIIGNPLDLIKTRLQAGTLSSTSTSDSFVADRQTQVPRSSIQRAGQLVKGASAPVLGYGALNAILFTTYNRTLSLLSSTPSSTPLQIWCAGAAGGLATFIVSAPTEFVKCRAQVSTANTSSWTIAKETWRKEGIRGLYTGGGITSVRDAVGYGFYFWSYELSKQALSRPDDSDRQTAMKVLLCGGLAGVVTWATIFPLDVVKTRLQTQGLDQPAYALGEQHALLRPESEKRLGALDIAKQAYRAEGAAVFFRGLGICSVRAFIVNAVQWAFYEWTMRLLQPV